MKIQAKQNDPAAPLRTMEEVGRIMGVCKQRIYQLELRALKKLKARLRKEPLIKEWLNENLPQRRRG
jgi:DNA-directed RNA polymerase sigma subunit (sigma70/sigma32)